MKVQISKNSYMSFVIGHQCYGSYIHLYRENLNEFAFKDDNLFPNPSLLTRTGVGGGVL